MKRLSIIVPVYNAEKYLSTCLESLIHQDIPLTEYEIIIVNDGSTDLSVDIADSYVSQYQNCILLSQRNTGCGAARNLGIYASKGKYLLFADADDYIFPKTLAGILKIIETQDLDALRFNYEYLTEEGEIIPKKKNATKSVVFSDGTVDGSTFLSNHLGWACYAWSFLFKTSFIKENNLIFNQTLYFEDVEWLIIVLLRAKKMQSINKKVYAYVQHVGSITHSIQTTKKNKVLSDKLYIINVLKRHSQVTNNRSVKKWCEGMISLTFMGVLAYVENELPNRKDEIIKVIYSKKYLPFKSYQFTLKQLRDLLIINISPHLYCYFKGIKRV